MYYHFAFLAVSIAMFGLGASSVFVYITPRWHPAGRATSHLARYATLFWFVTVLAAVVLLRVRVGLQYSTGTVVRLLVVYLVAAMPFAAGGAGLAVAVSRLHGDIGRVYAFHLAGAACGCLLLIPALDVFGGPGALLFAAGLAAVAAFLFARSGEPRRDAKWMLPIAAAAIGLAIQVRHPWLDVHEAK